MSLISGTSVLSNHWVTRISEILPLQIDIFQPNGESRGIDIRHLRCPSIDHEILKCVYPDHLSEDKRVSKPEFFGARSTDLWSNARMFMLASLILKAEVENVNSRA